MTPTTSEKEEKRVLKISPNIVVLSGSILLSGVLVSLALLYVTRYAPQPPMSQEPVLEDVAALEKAVLPEQGIALPVQWGSLGRELTKAGVIDETKMKELYEKRGGFTEEHARLLSGENNGELVITKENADYFLNLLWALGLGNKNPILEKGEMTDKAYGGAGKFASTGGWTLAKGKAMDHYSRHAFVTLTPEQQGEVARLAKNIYRPCCGNSTHFPDCNHGMAMLGLLQLMAAQGVGEKEMYQAALAVNSYWFPDTYLTLARYMKGKGIEWQNVSAEEILGSSYSSGSGYADIAAQVAPIANQGGKGCSV